MKSKNLTTPFQRKDVLYLYNSVFKIVKVTVFCDMKICVKSSEIEGIVQACENISFFAGFA